MSAKGQVTRLGGAVLFGLIANVLGLQLLFLGAVGVLPTLMDVLVMTGVGLLALKVAEKRDHRFLPGLSISLCGGAIYIILLRIPSIREDFEPYIAAAAVIRAVEAGIAWGHVWGTLRIMESVRQRST